jgi:hypothetical protein
MGEKQIAVMMRNPQPLDKTEMPPQRLDQRTPDPQRLPELPTR